MISNVHAVFRVHDIKVVKEYKDGTIEVEESYFVSRDRSVRFFDECELNSELKISESLICFYSKEKQRCIYWSTEKRKKLIEETKEILSFLEQSEIEVQESEK